MRKRLRRCLRRLTHNMPNKGIAFVWLSANGKLGRQSAAGTIEIPLCRTGGAEALGIIDAGAAGIVRVINAGPCHEEMLEGGALLDREERLNVVEADFLDGLVEVDGFIDDVLAIEHAED